MTCGARYPEAAREVVVLDAAYQAVPVRVGVVEEVDHRFPEEVHLSSI